MIGRLVIIMALGIVSVAGDARADSINFACPKAGVVEERSVGKITYTGPSPADPYICNRLDYANKPASLLFNIYELEDSSNAAVRAAMLELLTGRTTRVSFSYTSPRRYLAQHTWTYLRREKITIGGRPIETVVFDQDYEADKVYRAPFHGHYVRWLDPKNGLWLKSRYTFISGSTNGAPQSYEDRSVTLP